MPESMKRSLSPELEQFEKRVKLGAAEPAWDLAKVQAQFEKC